MNDNLYNLEEENTSIYSLDDESDLETQKNSHSVASSDDTEDYKGVSVGELDEELEDEIENEAEAWRGEAPEETEKSQETHAKGVILSMLSILSNPVEGWKNFKRGKFKEEKVASTCFYPLAALASVSEFAAYFYNSELSLNELLVPAIVIFISFFFGYFTVILTAGLLMPKAGGKAISKNFGKTFVMINMSTLALFYILYELMPMLGPVLAFLPLWTIYIIFKGIKFLRIPKEKETSAAGMMSFLTIGAPMFWYWILTELMPL